MSKDIRSFFKPLPGSKSTTQHKKDEIDSKRSPKKSHSTVKGKETSSKSSANSSDTKKEPSKTKKGTRKIEIISSDSDSDVIHVKKKDTRVKNSDEKEFPKSKNKTKLQKIELLSSDSEVDSLVQKRKSKQNSAKSKNITDKPKVSSENVILKKSINVITDSEDDSDFINQTPNSNINKKRKLQINSDSEDESKTKLVNKHSKPQSKETLKPVNISEIFGDKVKQSNVKTPKAPPETVPRKNKKAKTELGIHGDENFEKTLIDLDNDDDIFLYNEDILDKTIESTLDFKPTEKAERDDYKSLAPQETIHSKQKNSPIKSEPSPKTHLQCNRGDTKSVIEKDPQAKKTDDVQESSKKRPLENDGDTPSKNKKTKFNHTDSGFDDQDRFEKKRYCSMQYQKYLNRGGPKNHGSKELPKGKPDCLSNITFMRTGVLDSLEAEEFENLVKEHGGKVVHNVSRKVNYVVVGEDPGPTKLQKAENYKIPTISEDELLDMILQKSGMPKKFTVISKVSSFEDAGINESFISNASEEPLEKEGKPSKQIDLEDKINTTKEADIIEEKKVTKEIGETMHTNTNVKKEENSSNLSLSEKYKPKDLKQIVGQQMSNSNMNRLKKWLECWHLSERLRKQKKITQPKPWDKTNDGAYFKCALLSGPPGVGKTTTATLVAKSLGFDIVEFNASDTRSKKLLQQEVATALNSQNIASFNVNSSALNDKRVILMDEVDGMAGNEDRGGMQELIGLIKTSKIPIICMCNDRNHQKMKTLANYCFDLRFEKPKAQQILGFVMSICCKEGIKVNPQIAAEIINGTTCDIRQTLNQLSMLSNLEEGISLEQAQKDSANAKKDTILGPWQVCKMVFNEDDQKNMSLIDKSRLFFYDYSMGPLFIQENYLKVQPHVVKNKTMKQVAAASEAISMGAAIDKKIRESNNWSLLDLQAIYSSVLPGHYMSGHFTAAVDFPGWLGKNSKRNKIKRMTNELSSHTRIQTSGGQLAMNLDYSRALLTAIVTPLKKRGLEGVSDAVQVMKTYQLLREDLDNLVEVCSGPRQKSLMDGVESKVKAAFTRLYNKEVPLFSYSANAGVSKKKVSALYDDDELLNDDEVDVTSETEDTIENDNLIKSKSKSKTQTKKDTSKASTSKQTKTKGKGKK